MEENEKVLVSICCLVYNHAPYLRDCFEGFVMQQTTFKVEVLVHDDASSDNSADIIREYTFKYPELFKPIYQKENQYSKGIQISATYNFPRAKGKYIALCEGDDYWTDPLKLQKQVDFLEINSEYSGCVHQSTILSDDKLIGIFNKNVKEDICINDLMAGRLFHTATVIFRKKIFDNIEKIPDVLSGDRLFYFLMALNGKIRFFNESMCIYRKHSEGMSSVVTVDLLKKDFNMIPFLLNIDKTFPKYRYKSYLYITMGLCKNGNRFQRLYYLLMSCILSFSYFPGNIVFFCNKVYSHFKM
ncbi:glycosyltransferase family 2 protein [Butyricimonas virosa]|uniref:glycosyltransferase family 2 protein n=1 Tax=Butyricimonas virosa TaxID=544645 RepID=UPI000E44C9F0|nr:glycosyltransferase [Butyricimonas virosa]RGL84064.1 glycosyltransferase [Butyricimonas virosa]